MSDDIKSLSSAELHARVCESERKLAQARGALDGAIDAIENSLWADVGTREMFRALSWHQSGDKSTRFDGDKVVCPSG